MVLKGIVLPEMEKAKEHQCPHADTHSHYDVAYSNSKQ